MNEMEKIRVIELTLKSLENEISAEEFSELDAYVASSKKNAHYFTNCIATCMGVMDYQETVAGNICFDGESFDTDFLMELAAGVSADEFDVKASVEATNSGSGMLIDSNISLDGIDITKDVLSDEKEDTVAGFQVSLDNNITQALQELAEFEATAPTVHIEKPIEEPEKPAGPPVIKPARPVRKMSKFSVFTLMLSAAAMILLMAILYIVPERLIVGVLTDSIDAEWIYTKDIPVKGDPLCQGELILVKGLAEITLDDGAVVVIEAPAEIELESPKSMFVTSGKISAVVSEYATGFTVNTLSASIVDLGTEFGVRVESDGSCSLHMFKGKVNLIAGKKDQRKTGQIVNVNEARSVDSISGTVRDVRLGEDTFVRHIDSEKGFIWRGGDLNLADVVGGGNGFGSGQINYGIDAFTGEVVLSSDNEVIAGTGEYIQAPSSPFVDGVFVPKGDGAVQVSSTGLMYDDFDATNGNFWGGVFNGAWHKSSNVQRHQLRLDGVEYGVIGKSAICIHSNQGITFDLEEIRNRNPQLDITRFTSRCGISQTVLENDEFPKVDIRVLVDGHERFEELAVTPKSGAIEVSVELVEGDRFLTLVVTDGGDLTHYDWALFAEPVLELELGNIDRL